MQFYTYNVLGTEMSPFRWNGSNVNFKSAYVVWFHIIFY